MLTCMCLCVLEQMKDRFTNQDALSHSGWLDVSQWPPELSLERFVVTDVQYMGALEGAHGEAWGSFG